jgi:hypothetical protein
MCLVAIALARPALGETRDHAPTREFVRLIPPSDNRLAAADPSAMCEAAIRSAELRYHLPPGLLTAISLAESGRSDPTSRTLRPWPWAVQASATSLYFDTRTEAVGWVRAAQARGVTSIDTGCLQISLLFHQGAFSGLEAAFDPELNADYAARFLRQLYSETNDWVLATGFYHSRTASLAVPYRERVARMGGLRQPEARPNAAKTLAAAWRATLGTDAPRDKSRQATAPPARWP